MNELGERFARIPTKQKVALLVVIWAAMGALYYVLMYTDQQDQMKSLSQQLQRINRDKSKLRVIAEEKIKFEKRLQELEDQKKKAQAFLPDARKLEELTIELNRRARQAQIRITRIDPQKEVPMGFYSRMPVQLKLEGTFHQLVVFFNHVSEMKRIVNIKDVTMDRPVRRDGQVYLSASALATSYRSMKTPTGGATTKRAPPKARGIVSRGKKALQRGKKRLRGKGRRR